MNTPDFLLYLQLFTIQGFNDNPTAQQFEAAYRKLMVHNEVVCSKNSNCIDTGTKILTVSSRPATSKKNDSESDELAVNEDFLNQEFLDSCKYVDDII